MVEILQNDGSHRILAILAGLDGGSPLQLIEVCGRTAYQSRDRITDKSAQKFVEMLRERGHESVLEHSAMTVEFNNISRGFTHELVRHRLASFTQESTRYVDESNFRVVIPPGKEPDEELVELKIDKGQGRASDTHKFKVSFQQWMELNQQMYQGLIEAGWATEDARQVLPIGIKAQITMTANLREWRHIFELRCSPSAHWEIRGVMLDLLKDVQHRVPVVFDDFMVNEQEKTAYRES